MANALAVQRLAEIWLAYKQMDRLIPRHIVKHNPAPHKKGVGLCLPDSIHKRQGPCSKRAQQKERYFTVIIQVAFLPLSLLVAVMVALPFLTAVTLPFRLTLAILGLLDDQVIFVLYAFFGVTLAFSL